jgi:hypothetical protein
MVENNNDTNMKDGGGPRNVPPDIIQTTLNNTLKSFESQVLELTKTFKAYTTQLSNISSSNEKFYREFTRANKNGNTNDNRGPGRRGSDFGSSNLRNLSSLASDIEEFRKEVTSAAKSMRRDARSWKYTDKSFKGAGADIVSAKRRQEILDKFAETLDGYRQDLENRLRQEQSIYSSTMEGLSKEFDFQKYKREMDEMISQRTTLVENRKVAETTEDKQKITEQIKELQSKITERKTEALPYITKYNAAKREHETNINTIQEDISSQINTATRQKDSLINHIEEVFSDIEQAFEQAQDGVSAIRNRSLSMDKYMEKLEASKEEKFNEAVEAAREQVSDSMKVLEKKLQADLEETDERNKLTDEERENIKRQIEILKKEEEYLKKLTPLTDIWKDAGNKIKDTFRDSLFGSLDSFVKNAEDRYLQTYIDGFQNVYNSIESTRNTISARLKLNSGDYKEMQETLAAEIQTRGLSGSISMTDVDDMLVSLQTAGITDQQMLQELAIEGAKLKAQGSSLDLGNEETLQQIMQLYNQSLRQGSTTEEALNSITNMAERISGGEGAIRQEFGYDAALVNGGLNTIFNQAMKMGLASGKDVEQLTTDVISSAYGSQALYGTGVDESLIRQSLQSIFEGTVADSDTFAKILIAQTDLQDQLREGTIDMSQAMQYVMDNMQNILSNADPRYIAEIGKAYALPGTVTDWLNVQQRQDAFSVVPSDTFQTSIDSIIDADNKAIEQGDYLSRTQQVTKEYENKMTTQAIEAEQLYKGDQMVVGQLQNISNLVNSIYGILKGGFTSSLESIAKGGMEAFGKKSVSSMLGEKGLESVGSLKQGATQFLTGESGTALGTAGKIAGGAVGAYWMVDSIKDNIGDSFSESFENISTDPQFYRGLGTTLGSALAGPVGAAIGGVIGQVSSQIGNAIGDPLAEGLYNLFNDTDVTDTQLEAANRLLDASNLLNESAQKQAEEINSAKQNIVNQKEIFNNYDENMQKQFITQMGIDSTDMSNQEAFQKAIQKWEQIELRKIEEMDLKQKASENTGILNATIEQTFDGSLFEANKETQEKTIQDLISTGKLTDEGIIQEFQDYGVEYLNNNQQEVINKIWQQEQEKRSDLLKMQTEQGYKELALIEEQALRDYAAKNDLQEANGSVDLDKVRKTMESKGEKLDTETAIKHLYAEQVKEGYVSEADVAQMSQYTEILQDNRKLWEEDNKLFQNKWEEIVKENPGASIVDLVAAYNKKYLGDSGISVADVIDGFTVDNVGLSAQYTTDDSGKPMLRSKSGSGTRLYDPSIYHGKFESGLTEVPFDMYPALLHEGERVLTKQEADAYNELSSFAVSQIANETTNRFAKNTNYFNASSIGMDKLNGSITEQTKKQELMLGEILEALKILIKETRNSKGKVNTVNTNALKMNTNLTTLNT